MKYIIKSCNKRLWYVREILVPEMMSQGISGEDIVVYNDDEGVGCLMHCINCFAYASSIPNTRGWWYMQDDVAISKQFKQLTEEISPHRICNGFASKQVNPKEYEICGYVPIGQQWWSFQCIYIPNNLARGFVRWIYQKTVVEKKYAKQVKAKKYDDMLFWQYMRERHPDELVLNMTPNVVQHIDYLIGGSSIDTPWKKNAVSAYFDEPDTEARIQKLIKEREETSELLR